MMGMSSGMSPPCWMSLEVGSREDWAVEGEFWEDMLRVAVCMGKLSSVRF